MPSDDLTLALQAAGRGDESAAARILPMVYDELRSLAAARMHRVPPGQTLQATALVHEAYVRVAGKPGIDWDGRAHFFHAAARAMRDILVEDARRKATLKRGGDRDRQVLDGDGLAIETPVEDMLSLDEALTRLEADDPDKAHIVMLRYFTGLTVDETASVLETSVSSVERGWRYARAWLRREMEMGGQPGGSAAQ